MRKNIMKKLIAAVCTVSMVMGSISFGAMAEEEMLEITKQPTVGNPTVDVNKTEDVEYQWYEGDVEKTISVVDGIVDENGERIFVASSSAIYDESEDVWSADPDLNKDNAEIRFYVYIDLEVGDKLYIKPYSDANIEVKINGTSKTANSEGIFIYESRYDGMTSISVWEKAAGENVAAQFELERDGKLYKIVDGMKEEFDDKLVCDSNSCYDENQDLWESESLGSGTLQLLIYSKENQVINFDFVDKFSGSVNVIDYSTATYGENVKLDSAENLLITISKNGYYYISINGDRSFETSIKIKEVKAGLAVEGQNTNVLTDYEENKLYRCKVTCGNETVYSDYIIGKLLMISQPTASDPTVGFNYDIDATYQWYNVGEKTYEVVDLGDEVGESQINVTDWWGGEYSDGQWNSRDGEIDIAFEVEKGDKVVVILPEDFDGAVEEYDYLVDFVYNDGVYEAVIDKALDWINLFVYSNEDFIAEVYIEHRVTDSIVGENKATLMNPEYGKSYLCKATYEGKEYVSDIVTMTMAPSKQPSLSDLSFKMNFEDKVAAYQWYEVEEAVYKVVDTAAVTPENMDDVVPAMIMTGTYEDGKWKGESNTYGLDTANIVMLMGEFEANTVLYIQLSVSDIELVQIMDVSGRADLIDETDNGLIKYTFPVSEVYMIGIAVQGEFTAEISVVKSALGEAIDDQTTSRLTKHVPGIYMCEATLTDGSKIYSDVITITENDDVHVYTDMYDPDCNDCGDIRQVPDRPVDSDDGDTGNGGTGNGGTGNGDTGNGGTGNDGTGNGGTGNGGTGNGGTENSGAGNNGTGNSGAGNNATGNGGAGSNSANKAPDAGDSVNVAWLMAIAVAAMAGSMLVSLKKKRA